MLDLLETLKQNVDLANALGTLASTTTAVVALAVSLVTLRIQRRHNVVSLKPLPMISVEDFENKLRVSIENTGPGPLIITQLYVDSAAGRKDALVDCMPELPTDMHWTMFIGPTLQPRAIGPNGDLTVLELDGDHNDRVFCGARDECRRELSKLKLVLHYTDVYGSPMAPCEKPLTWFARHAPAISSESPTTDRLSKNSSAA